MHAVFDELRKTGIIPVIKIDDAGKAVPLAAALAAGGIPCAEITFRTAQAEEAIRRIHGEAAGIVLGAGTVLSVEQADKAIAAGAAFIVSPGFNANVVRRCIEKGVPCAPGCATPSDIEAALELGLEVVKFFPAEQNGGLDYIKAVAAPYPSMRFIPTGGINAGNIAAYLGYEKIIACGGTWMVRAEDISAGAFEAVTALCKEAMMTQLGFEAVHTGINMDTNDDAERAASRFSALFGFENKAGASSIFSGSGIEIMKRPGFGANGHIAIAANSVFRAMAFLERQGIRFRKESAKTDAQGNVTVIYLEDEVGGFAVHLIQRS